MTNVDVADPPAARPTLAGDRVHVALAGSPEQVRATVPLNAALAVSVRDATPFCPRGIVSEAGLGVRVNPGLTEVTVTGTAEEVTKLKLPSPP
jgi:hypothetical protein